MRYHKKQGPLSTISILSTVLVFLTFITNSTLSQVSINTDGTDPDPSAILDLKSNTRGFLMPRMTADNRDNIVDKNNGLIIYCNSDNEFWFYNEILWNKVLPLSDEDWTISGNNLYNTYLNGVSIGTGNVTDWNCSLYISGSLWQSGFGSSTYIGKGSGDNDDGSTNLNNTCIGYNTGNSLSAGNQNVFVGAYAGEDVEASGYGRNVAIGAYALKNGTSCSDNTAIGYNCMLHATSGSYNTSIGSGNLMWGGAANYNTTIGYVSSSLYNTDSYSTAFGYNTKYTASNQVRIGNSEVTSIGGFTNWTNISDKRFKTNITESVPGLNFILKLRPISYRLDIQSINDILNTPKSDFLAASDVDAVEKKESIIYSGFIPQEVEAAAQSIGYDFSGVDPPKNENDLYGLRYATFVMPLIKAVQEQQALIDELNAIADARDKEITELEELVNQLKQKNPAL